MHRSPLAAVGSAIVQSPAAAIQRSYPEKPKHQEEPAKHGSCKLEAATHVSQVASGASRTESILRILSHHGWTYE
jgi:hypothetical protein